MEAVPELNKADFKLTPQRKKIITHDWQKEFPSLMIFNRYYLCKRVGPLKFYIGYDTRNLLKKDQLLPNACYRIGGSYCNLLNASDFTYAALSFEPKSRRYKISWEQHEKGLYMEAVEEMRKLAPLPMEGPITLSQVVKAYEEELAKEWVYPREYKLQDPPLIAAWAGLPDLGKELAIKYYTLWNERILEKKRNEPDAPDAFPLEELEVFLPRLDTDKLRALLETEVVRHGLDKVPYQELIIDL